MWTIKKIQPTWRHMSKVIFVDECTKNDIITLLSSHAVAVGNEIECFFQQGMNTPIAWHNITQDITFKKNPLIYFPHELAHAYTYQHLDQRDIRFQNLHYIATNPNLAEYVYDKYDYLVQCGKISRWWRDPRNYMAFANLKQIAENTRNILFFYHIEKARERILYTYDYIDNTIVTEEWVKTVITTFYDAFLDDTLYFPIVRQDLNEFQMYFGDIRQKVWL